MTTNLPVSLRSLLIAHEIHAPLRINPEAKASEKLVERFAVENNLVFPEFKLVNTMSAFLFPEASLKKLTLIGQLNCLLYYIDDIYGDAPYFQGISDDVVPYEAITIIANCAETFISAELASNNPLVDAFLKIRCRMEQESDSAWLERFARSLYNHLMCVIDPAHLGHQKIDDLSLSGYVAIREHLSGMYPTTDLIEFANDAYLPDSARQNAVLERLRLACIRIGGLTNDLFSYHKEVVLLGHVLNLVSVIEENYQIPLPQAIAEAIQFVNGETGIFVATLEIAKEQITDEVTQHYIAGLRYQVGATWHWQMNTNRYRSPDSPFVELQTYCS